MHKVLDSEKIEHKLTHNCGRVTVTFTNKGSTESVECSSGDLDALAAEIVEFCRGVHPLFAAIGSECLEHESLKFATMNTCTDENGNVFQVGLYKAQYPHFVARCGDYMISLKYTDKICETIAKFCQLVRKCNPRIHLDVYDPSQPKYDTPYASIAAIERVEQIHDALIEAVNALHADSALRVSINYIWHGADCVQIEKMGQSMKFSIEGAIRYCTEN